MPLINQTITYRVSSTLPGQASAGLRWAHEIEIADIRYDYSALRFQLDYAGKSICSVSIPALSELSLFFNDEVEIDTDAPVCIFYRARDAKGTLIDSIAIAEFDLAGYSLSHNPRTATLELTAGRNIAYSKTEQVLVVKGLSNFSNQNGQRSVTCIYDPRILPGVKVRVEAGGFTDAWHIESISHDALGDGMMSLDELKASTESVRENAESFSRPVYPGIVTGSANSVASVVG